MSETSENLVGYCGLYCGACGIRQGRIKQAVENLRKLVGFYGFDKIASGLANWEPAFRHYAEYEKVLDGFVKLFGDCPGCVAGGGDPNCAVRECCRPKAYTTCAECAEMDTCGKLIRLVQTLERLREVKAKGVDRWAAEMQKKVEAGYCVDDEKLK